MNVKVDSQNVIPFPQVDLRPGKRDGADLNALAVRESFGEILEREFQIHSDKPKSTTEWKPLNAEKQSYESHKESDSKLELENKSNPTIDEMQRGNETSVQKNKEDEVEETEEEELDRDALEYSISILSNHSLFEKNFTAANETNESQKKEKTISQSLQKSGEKNPAYVSKESKSFVEETQRLTESFSKLDPMDLQKNLDSKKQTLRDASSSNLVLFPNAQKKGKTEIAGNEKNSISNPNAQKLESNPNSMSISSFLMSKDKGIRGLEADGQMDGSLRKFDTKGKTSKNNKLEGQSLESLAEKENTNVVMTSDKMIRSLGFKEKEFQKLNDNKTQLQTEKQKADASLGIQITNVSSSKMGEENGKSFEDKGSKPGFSLHSVEQKLQSKMEDVKNTEKAAKPKETNLKQNLDELIKQAKFDIVQNGKSSAEIIMNPKEYGRLTLKVTVDGEKVEGRILVESEELQKSLQNEIQTIKENLKESGLDLQSLIVDLWEETSQFADRQNQNELYQTLVETAKNRGKMGILETEEGLDLEGISPATDSQVLEFFA